MPRKYTPPLRIKATDLHVASSTGCPSWQDACTSATTFYQYNISVIVFSMVSTASTSISACACASTSASAPVLRYTRNYIL